jgi:hypothetical protein
MITPLRARMVFSAVWFTGIAAVVASGFSADGYKLHVMRIPLPHPYPFGGVVVTSVALTVELALIYAVIRPSTYARSWGRALGATIVAAVALLLSAPLLMHAPIYFFVHSLILLCLTAGLAVLFLASAAAAARQRLARVRD